MDAANQQRVQSFRKNYSLYQQNRDLINVGAYHAGSDPEIDRAIEFQPRLMEFLSQDMSQAVSLEQSYTQLMNIMDLPANPAPQAAAVSTMPNPAMMNGAQ